MVVKTVSKYANTVTDQYNPNKKGYTHWTKPENAIGHVTNTSATATYTKEKYATHYTTKVKKDKNGKEIKEKVADKWDYKYTKPTTLSAHDFGLEIPNEAKVTSIKFEVRIKVSSSKLDVLAPKVRFNIYGGSTKNHPADANPSTTGWHSGHYYVYPKSTKLSTSYKTITYTLDGNDMTLSKTTPSNFNIDVMGIDLIFDDGFVKADTKSKLTGTASVQWVRCTAEYIMADSNLKITTTQGGGTETSPALFKANTPYYVTFTLSNGSSKAYGNISVVLDFPQGCEYALESYHGSWSPSTNTWSVNLGGKETKTISFYVTSKRTGINFIKATKNGQEYFFYYNTSAYGDDGYSDLQVLTTSELHINHLTCLKILASGYSNDDTVTIDIINPSNIQYVDASLDSNCRNIKEIESKNNSTIVVKLVEAGDYTLSLNYCVYPIDNPCGLIVRNNDDPSHEVTQSFEVKAPYTYVISNSKEYENEADLHPSLIKINNHRVITDISTDASIIELVSDEVDSTMIMSPCTIAMDTWDDLDYIGCVPLEHLHFDPKSTYKDTLIDSRYKNKRYMGKKLATDEDITLNVRLHPQQVTTIQGLIDMDKPIPINANHRCFEGDALNHRGWAEIYSIKAEETNPSWYKCDIDVKYLTHNLNTRFKIDKGKKIDDYQIPSLLTETFSSGDNLSDMDGEPYFSVDTDGTFYYSNETTELEYPFTDDNDDTITVSSSDSATYSFVMGGETHSFVGITAVVEFLESRGYKIATPVANQTLKVKRTVETPPYERNNFNIQNGQHIVVTTVNPLTHTSTVDFTWSSALIEEAKENAISRIVRLIGTDNRILFEYQYDNLSIIDDEVTADVIYRVREGDALKNYNEDITFRYNPSDVTSEFDDVEEEEDSDISTGDAHFGTTLSLIIDNGKLSIRDSGFNGREVFVDNITLADTSYRYQVEWINENDDEETNDIDCIFDFMVQDTVLSTTYADKWGKLIVSPFPVADKKILFTRLAEEGTIYYYSDDEEEFSYLIEPYYQYLNGTDLITDSGISIFNLNYGYRVVYIQNGLVRLGFNRLTGELYLGKYDPISDSYITVSRLHLEKFDDINLNSITDDKIEIQASDAVFTIYRGHPYIKVKHELEDIIIDTQYNSVWAEQVGSDNAVELPAYWDLMNNKNLLPIGVGGKINSNDLEITSEYVDDRIPTTLEFDTIVSENEEDTDPTFTTGYTITATLTDEPLTSYTDDIDIDDSQCSFGSIEWSESCDVNTPSQVLVSATPNIVQSGDTSKIYANVLNACNIGVGGITVNFYEVYEPWSLVLRCSPNIIQATEVSTLTASLKDEDGSAIRDEVVYFQKDIDSTNWNMELDEPSDEVISIGETLELSTTVVDANNNPVEGIFVLFYVDDDEV